MRELTKDDVTDADVEAVEEAVGMGCGAWDCVSARKIIAAAWNRRSAVLSLVDASPAPQQTPVAPSGVVHELKTWSQYFGAVLDGSKTFEARFDDREFEVGDVLHLREWNPETEAYTGRETRRTVSYKLSGGEFVRDSYCILGLRPVSVPPEAASEPVEKVLRDTETYRAMLAQDRYPANFREQAKGVEGVVLPLGSTEAVTRLLRDLVAWGFGMGQAQPESSELLSWHERADATTAKLREHFAASQAENLLLGLHKIVADLAPYFDKPLTEESMPRWLALDSAQKTVAQYFAASQGEAERGGAAVAPEILEQVNAERIAGMLSTLDFRPAERHPSECVPMAKAVLAEITKNLPLYARSAGEGTPAPSEVPTDPKLGVEAGESTDVATWDSHHCDWCSLEVRDLFATAYNAAGSIEHFLGGSEDRSRVARKVGQLRRALAPSPAPQQTPVAWPTRKELCDAVQRCVDEATETARDGDPEGPVVSVEAAEAFAKMLDVIYASPASVPESEDGPIAEIAAERARQKSVEGWTEAHDDDHAEGELARAAACYAMVPPQAVARGEGEGLKRLAFDPPTGWPWDADFWHPCPNNRRRELIKAGALIVAEIERLDRIDAALHSTADKGDGNG
jgi:hypothetical protein